jgi:serine protease
VTQIDTGFDIYYPHLTAADKMTTRLLAIAFLAAASASSLTASRADAAPYRPGEVVVRFRGEDAGRELELPSKVSVHRAVAALSRNRAVRYAVPNYLAHASLDPYTPNDPGRADFAGGWQLQQWNFLPQSGVDAPGAWANLIAAGKPGARGTTIAVLDTGVAYRTAGRFRLSPDLGRWQFVAGYDFVSRDRRPYDDNGHGTHVASTIGELTDNRVGLTGLAYGARMMPLRVLDSNGAGDAADISKGIRYAARRRADVINMSLEFDSSIKAREIPEITAAVRYAVRRGSLLVAASGNEGSARVAYPARQEQVLAIGGTTEHLCQAEYSNEGRGLDLMAPGGGHDATVPGDPNCRPSEDDGRDIDQLTFTSNVRTFGYPGGFLGTSMAAPHAAAIAAMVIASGVIGPNPSPQAIESWLERTSRDLGAPGYDTRYGWGLINANAATTPPA